MVQPAFGIGLVVLLVLGVVVLHERVGAQELVGVGAVAGAVAILGFAAPAETGRFVPGAVIAIAVVAPLVGLLPAVLRRLGREGGLVTSLAAGVGWGWVALATSLADVSVAQRHWLAALGWGLAVAVVSFGALVAEMSSLQTWPATRAVPIAFGFEMIMPAALAPFLTRAPLPHPAAFAAGLALATAGAVVLGTSRAVARAAAA